MPIQMTGWTGRGIEDSTWTKEELTPSNLSKDFLLNLYIFVPYYLDKISVNLEATPSIDMSNFIE